MILQALKSYYDRKAAEPDSDIAPEGWEYKEIPFIVVLDYEGNLLQIEDTRQFEGKKKIGKSFLVPQAVKKTSGISANLLWDTSAYVFGVVNTDNLDKEKSKKVSDRVLEQKKAFYNRIDTELPKDRKTEAVLRFLRTITIARLQSESAWEEIYESNPLISFRFNNENYFRLSRNQGQKEQFPGPEYVDNPWPPFPVERNR
jgi:CRISPR-associated protein Csd1